MIYGPLFSISLFKFLLKVEEFYIFLFSMVIISFHTNFLCNEGYFMAFCVEVKGITYKNNL